MSATLKFFQTLFCGWLRRQSNPKGVEDKDETKQRKTRLETGKAPARHVAFTWQRDGGKIHGPYRLPLAHCRYGT